MMNNERVVSELIRIARDLMAGRDRQAFETEISPFKTKLFSVKAQRPMIFKAIKNIVSVPLAGAVRVYEDYMIFTSGTSNKYHYFAIYKIRHPEGDEFVGANVWGRIGRVGGAVEIARSDDKGDVLAAVKKKARLKARKGYETTRHASASRIARMMSAGIRVDIDFLGDEDEVAGELEALGAKIVKTSRGKMLFDVPSSARRKVKRWMIDNGYDEDSDYPEFYPGLYK